MNEIWWKSLVAALSDLAGVKVRLHGTYYYAVFVHAGRNVVVSTPSRRLHLHHYGGMVDLGPAPEDPTEAANLAYWEALKRGNS